MWLWVKVGLYLVSLPASIKGKRHSLLGSELAEWPLEPESLRLEDILCCWCKPVGRGPGMVPAGFWEA